VTANMQLDLRQYEYEGASHFYTRQTESSRKNYIIIYINFIEKVIFSKQGHI